MQAKDYEMYAGLNSQMLSFTPELDQQSYTPLMITIQKAKSLDEILPLIQSGSDVNAVSLLGSTPVMFAAQRGYFVPVKYLVDHGANLEHRNLAGWNTFTYAVSSNNFEIVQWLVYEKKIALNADDVNTSLLVAALSKNIKMLYFIFENFEKLVGDIDTIMKMGKNAYFDIGKPENNLYFNFARELLLLKNDRIKQENINTYPTIDNLRFRLPQNPSLRKLISRPCDDLQELCDFITYYRLEELQFINNLHRPFDSGFFSAAFMSLLQNKDSGLKKLDLNSCKIGLEEATVLADFIEQSKTLECLNLAYCELGPEATKIIVDSINRNPTVLNTLDLTYNKIGIEGAQAVSNLLRNPACALQMLTLTANYYTGDKLLLIADAMKSNTSISILYLPGIDTENNHCITAIASMIATNNTLSFLNLSSRCFTDDQGVMIANALKSNTSIKDIEIMAYSGSSFGVESATTFGDMLKINKTLQKIDLSCHKELSGGLKYLVSGLSKNNTLIKLNLSGSNLFYSASLGLLKILKYYNCTLQEFSCYMDFSKEIDNLLDRNKKLASHETSASELKNIMDEIRMMRWQNKTPLKNNPYSLRFMLSSYSNKIRNQVIRDNCNRAIHCQDKQEVINSFLKC